MTKAEFIKNACQMGYCTKKQAEEYCKDKDDLTEDDYIEVYRKRENQIKVTGVALYGGGRRSTHKFRDGGEEGNR